MALPDEPRSRVEQYLSRAATGSGEIPEEAITRIEQYLAKIATGSGEVPEEAYTRIEQYLAYIAEHGGGGGGGDITLTTLNVSQNGTTNAPSGTAYNKVTANVANTYAASDEGKVVSNGALVAQTAHATVTENGTIDTTLNNSVVVDVQAEESGNGLVDLVFNYTDSVNNTISGTISNNYVQNLSSPATYMPPFMLKNPITINTGDVITLTFSNISVAAGGTGLNWSDCGLVTPAYREASAGSQVVVKISNFNFPNSGRVEKTVTYSGPPQLISGVALWARGNAVSGVSYEIHLTINGTNIF